MKNIFISILISVFTNITYSQNALIDSLQHKDNKTILIKLDNTGSSNNNNIKDILIVAIPSLISLIGFFLLSRDVKKQIKLSKEQFKKQNKLKFINDFKHLVVSLLTELDPSNGVDYEHHRNTGFYSDKHQSLHYELIMLLDLEDENEKKMIKKLNLLKIKQDNLSIYLKDIIELGSTIIKSRKEELI